MARIESELTPEELKRRQEMDARLNKAIHDFTESMLALSQALRLAELEWVGYLTLFMEMRKELWPQDTVSPQSDPLSAAKE